MSRLIPAAVEEGCALCSSPSPAQCLRLFLCIHPGVYVIALLCAFIYCFLITSGTEHLIILFVGHLDFISSEVSVHFQICF